MNQEKQQNTKTYQIAAEFLSDLESVEDWGCGDGGFKKFCKSPYIGIDGSETPFADKNVDLCKYRSSVDGVIMRHVLEHNYHWEKILANAVASAKKKLCLILCTPFQMEGTEVLAHSLKKEVDVPYLGFRRDDIEKHFDGWHFKCSTFTTATCYGIEHVYLATKKTRICIISANLGGIDECKMAKHVQQELPSGWYVKHFHYDSSNTMLRKNALHPRMQAKIFRMYGWQLHPGYGYYIWLDASFIISSPQMAKWMVDACGSNDMVVFPHGVRSTVKSEALHCIKYIQQGDPYAVTRYGSEPIGDQITHYYKNEPGFKDNFLIESGAFLYKPTVSVKKMLQDWYLECCRWTCQDQISLPVVLQRHGIKTAWFDSSIYKNNYLEYVHHIADST